MKLRSFPFIACLVLLASPASAAPKCPPTERVATQNYPRASTIPTSNNLLQPAGKAVEAEGQKFILVGRVLDSTCTPIPEAVVELWQNNPFGKWTLAGSTELATPNAVFAGAGRTYTDGDGVFRFITAFPAPLGKRAPFVNVKVSASGLKNTSTALFFSDDARNDSDAVYKKLSAKTREDVTIKMQQDANGELTGLIDIVLPGKAPHRTY